MKRIAILGSVCVLSSTLLLPAGCGEGEGHEPNPEWVPLWNQSAVCTVRVSGGNYSSMWGYKKVETEYLPRVLWCEVGVLGQDPDFLKAMAIAARTFLYKRLTWRSSMRNSTSDQVYYSSHCKSKPAQAYYDAVRDTAGMVMLKPGGSLHHGYYRAGRNSCSAYGECHDEPCLGQKNAAACARAGSSWQQILNKYYSNPTLYQAPGSCSGGSGTVSGGSTEPESCFYAGIRGECQSTSTACAGSYRPYLCNGPSDVQCCLPPEATTPAPSDPTAPTDPAPEPTTSEWGTCEYASRPGVCQQTTQSCDGSYQSGLCPGGNDVRCCVSWPSCEKDGVTGSCQNTSQTCAGTFHTGLCPGPSDIRCCIPQ